jgi:hypothetical protein
MDTMTINRFSFGVKMKEKKQCPRPMTMPKLRRSSATRKRRLQRRNRKNSLPVKTKSPRKCALPRNVRLFDPHALKNLVSVLAEPIAVFSYRKTARNLIIDLRRDENHFLVGV